MPKRVLVLTDEEAHQLLDWYTLVGEPAEDEAELAAKVADTFGIRGDYASDLFEAS